MKGIPLSLLSTAAIFQEIKKSLEFVADNQGMVKLMIRSKGSLFCIGGAESLPHPWNELGLMITKPGCVRAPTAHFICFSWKYQIEALPRRNYVPDKKHTPLDR